MTNKKKNIEWAKNRIDEPQANSQIDKLANFIMSEVEGEPSQSQGAVDTAIRIIKSYQNQEIKEYDERIWPFTFPVEEVEDEE